MLGQFSVICIFGVLERFQVVSISLFEFISCYSNVTLFLFVVGRRHISSVDCCLLMLFINEGSCRTVCLLMKVVVRQLPSSINKRINKLSCNEATFNDVAPLYTDALKRSNFVNTDLTYEPNRDNKNSSTRPTRQRNVIWYNPPFSKNVRTNKDETSYNLSTNTSYPHTNYAKFSTATQYE